MKKKYFFGLLFILTFGNYIFSDEWDYVPNIQLRYLSNESVEGFRELGGTFNPNNNQYGYQWHRISKLPREVNQAIWNELRSYDLESGDVFFLDAAMNMVE